MGPDSNWNSFLCKIPNQHQIKLINEYSQARLTYNYALILLILAIVIMLMNFAVKTCCVDFLLMEVFEVEQILFMKHFTSLIKIKYFIQIFDASFAICVIFSIKLISGQISFKIRDLNFIEIKKTYLLIVKTYFLRYRIQIVCHEQVFYDKVQEHDNNCKNQ